tara:strand:+ start:417 stop:542 length:126 start_codon:yes stop_codon:yes gene_type:complete
MRARGKNNFARKLFLPPKFSGKILARADGGARELKGEAGHG